MSGEDIAGRLAGGPSADREATLLEALSLSGLGPDEAAALLATLLDFLENPASAASDTE